MLHYNKDLSRILECPHCKSSKLAMEHVTTTRRAGALIVYRCGDCGITSTLEVVDADKGDLARSGWVDHG